MSDFSANPWRNINSANSCQELSGQNNSNSEDFCLQFEDNFIAEAATQNTFVKNSYSCGIEPLPDSANYLKLLERKLEKLKKSGSKLVESLADKRQDCMRNLLESQEIGQQFNTNSIQDNQFELDTPIHINEIQRHLLPVQAQTVGEILHIVKHDILEKTQEAAEAEIAEEQQQSNQNQTDAV